MSRATFVVMDDHPQLLNVAELARLLGRGRAFALGLVEDGALPCIWHRNRRYIPRQAVEAWLAGGGQVPAEPATVAVFPRQARRAVRRAA